MAFIIFAFALVRFLFGSSFVRFVFVFCSVCIRSAVLIVVSGIYHIRLCTCSSFVRFVFVFCSSLVRFARVFRSFCVRLSFVLRSSFVRFAFVPGRHVLVVCLHVVSVVSDVGAIVGAIVVHRAAVRLVQNASYSKFWFVGRLRRARIEPIEPIAQVVQIKSIVLFLDQYAQRDSRCLHVFGVSDRQFAHRVLFGLLCVRRAGYAIVVSEQEFDFGQW